MTPKMTTASVLYVKFRILRKRHVRDNSLILQFKIGIDIGFNLVNIQLFNQMQ